MSNAPSGAPIRIAVADDHPVVREGLVAMLETQPDFAIVGSAARDTDALALVASADPDVLLLDLEMPELDGVGVLGARQGADAERLPIGLPGILKGAPRADVFSAVRVVAAGGSLLAPLAASAVLRRVRGESPPTAPSLTMRERMVLEHLARGLGNKQIAARLGITERTVKFHVSSVFTKLGAANRTEAVTRAAQAGLIEL